MGPLFDPALLDAIEGAIERFDRIAWRQVIVGTDPLRTNVMGGRWNPRGVEALYCSLTSRGAQIELQALLDRQSVAIRRAPVAHRLSVVLSRVARVSESAAFAAAGVDRDAVLGPDWTLPQTIGAAAEWLGLAGLLVPSARHDDGNLVILSGELGPADHCQLAPEARDLR